MSEKTNNPIEKVRQLQRKLYLSAKQSKTRRFHALYERMCDWEVLEESWKRVRSNRGTAGIDGETLETIESKGVEAFLKKIQSYLQEGRYHPVAVRRVEIPKRDGGKRPLGIPTVRDRVVQMAAKIVLEPIFEADCKEASHGYRPKRGALGAMEKIRELANQGYNHVLDADIRNYFGSIDHEKLIEAVGRRISDRRMMKLIIKWLRAGVMVEGQMHKSLVGTPQGGVISPLLSNIYLHQMDEIWERDHAELGVLVRYCDDFVVLTRTRQAAMESREKIKRLLEGLKLEFHPEKTEVVNLAFGKEALKFFGWYVRKCPSVKFAGKYFLNRWPSPESMGKLFAKIRAVVHKRVRVRNVRELAVKLNPVLRGWANYFRTGTSRRKFEQADKYLWERFVLFENKRRRHTKPYWKPGRWDYAWFKGLGLFDLTGPGLVRYPGGTYAKA